VIDAITTRARGGDNGLSVEQWCGFVESASGVHRGTTARGVGTHVVVIENEAVDLGLDIGDGRVAGLRGNSKALGGRGPSPK
jgi:hypothetical protein